VLPERPGDDGATRVGDAERESAVAALRAACAAGYLTLDEFAERAGRAYAARTAGELAALTADVPVPAAPAPRRRETRRVVGIMGAGKVRGRWRPASRVTAIAFWGGCHLDFRSAEIDGPEVEVTAVAVMGGVDIVVPEGIAVELGGVAIMGGKELRVADVARRPGAPVIRVRAFAFWGGVTVRSKPAGAGRPEAQAARAGRGPARRTRDLAESDPHELARAVLDHVFGAGRPTRVPWPAGSQATVTLLFSDIEGFTALTERLGDARAQEVLRRHNALVREQVVACDGHEVKSVGDSFMVAFTSVTSALRCATGIQRAMASYRAAHPEAPVRVRIGVHTGEAIREGDDLFGRTVILASRIADHARGDEVLVSSMVVQLADGAGAFAFDEGREVTLKGIAHPQRVHALKWEGAP
jgi:class 3 adenylate cyclase